ncbi:MAG: NADP oxidoreductase [Anaerolineales bacterium]|nr:NADP oxidoreductase [Anaerolineales bacterium]
MSEKVKLATVWLDGCSGCHMSFLDIDERILELAARADLVYSPLVDPKTFPEMVDVTLIEGAVSSEEDYEKIQHVRAHTRILVSLGDCAVTANVPGMRNAFKVDDVYKRAYVENADTNQHIPVQVIPPLRQRSVPVHNVVKVDVFVPGCPPSADLIYHVLTELLDGRIPDVSGMTRFGA